MATESEVAKLLAQEVVNAIKVLADKNNQSYVNNQIANHKMTTSNVSSDLYARFADISIANVKKAKIDTAQIENLYASYGEFINITAEKAAVGDLEAGKLAATLADMSVAHIKDAAIDIAKVNFAVTGDTVIGSGSVGKLFIDNLGVTSANIVSLAADKIIFTGESGDFVQLVADEEGNVHAVPVKFDANEVIADGELNGDKILSINGEKLVNGSIDHTKIGSVNGGVIIKNSITAGQLNASEIFGTKAIVEELLTGVVKSGSVESATGSFGSLVTAIINSPNYKAAIELTDDTIRGIAEKIILDASRVVIGSGDARQTVTDRIDEVDGVAASAKLVADSNKGVIDLIVTQNGETSKIELTPEMIELISNDIVLTADKINAVADQINLSTNQSVVISAGQITNPNEIDLSENSTVVVTADKINEIADEIDLTGNDTVRVTADKVNAIANDIDLSGNESVRITAEKINAVADDIQLVGNKSISMLVGDNAWFEFDPKGGFIVRRPAYTDEHGTQHPSAIWYTSTKEDSFNVNRQDRSTPILSCVRDRVKTPSLQIGGEDDSTEIVVKKTSSGGWVFTDA